ncbi:MAG: T9SS type A sorting domain-containing protein [Bacteroidia bacterium]|nr:T9SS type A sorting domain-containing protein [Bacteroidia bacterium]
MKTILTVFLFFLTSTIYSQFMVENTYKLWHIYADNCDPLQTYTYYIKSDGDTIIGADSCIKIKEGNNSPYYWSNYSFIREANGKVFLKCSPQDILLYDFNALVGDTIHLLNVNLIVGYIDTEFYEGRNRKIMMLYYEGDIFDPFHCETWYEGIGSLCGLLYPGEYGLIGGPHTLLGYAENDTAMYYTTITDNKTLINNNTFQVYPIPANHKLHFSHFDNNNKEYRIEILNVNGVIMDSFKILYNGDIEKNIEAYKSGIYFYKLYENSKLIKIDKIIIEQ